MKFLLDSNAVIALLQRQTTFLKRLRAYQPADFGLPAIVTHELYFGAYKSQRPAQNLARVEALQFEVLELDREDLRRAGAMRSHLATAGTPIGPHDVLIAGQALARELTLITHNTQEFKRVPGLRFENWE